MIRREAATTSQANLPKTRKLIEWSPHVPSQFVVGTSADLRLYDIQISKGKKNLSANYSKFSIEDPYEGKTLTVSNECLKLCRWTRQTIDLVVGCEL